MLEQYILLLLASGLLAAVVSLLYSMGQGAYYQIIDQVTVDYLKLLNYSLSIAAGTFFFYLFAGTFLLAVVGLVLRAFVKLRFIELVKILCVAITPVLLLGWLSQRLAIALLLWAIILLIMGVKGRQKTGAKAVRATRKT